MFCPNCGTENPHKSEFCNECGILLNNNIKNNKQEDKKNLIIFVTIGPILAIGFMLHQYLAAIIVSGVVIFLIKQR